MGITIEDSDAPDRGDLILASIFMGIFLGFGYFAVYYTVLETRRTTRFAVHVLLCWGEIVAGVFLAVLAYLHNIGILGPSVWLYFAIVSAWAIQVHCLLQIIVSQQVISPARFVLRIHHPGKRALKLSVAILWTVLCISVYCIWIPAQLQISPRVEAFNFYWDRLEKSIYLLTDVILNLYFIYTVKTRLVQHGLTKYDRLVRFNQSIIAVSLSTDCLLIGFMSLPNHFVYTQFHSVAFMIKLNIEIAMFGLIVKVAQTTGITDYDTLHIISFAIGSTDGPQSRQVSAPPEPHSRVQVEDQDREGIRTFGS